MKLIIDISEETYNDIQSRDWKNGELIFSEEWKVIHHGTPLDKIRAEIEQMNEDALNLLIPFDSIDNANYTRGFIDGLGSALDCIDKYRGEVSK